VGWTGPDCSQRTCPLGIAYDTISDKDGQDIADVRFDKGFEEDGTAQSSGSAGLTVRVPVYQQTESRSFVVRMLKSGNAVSYQWKYDTDTAFGAPVQVTADDTGSTWACGVDAPCELTKTGSSALSTGVYLIFAEIAPGGGNGYEWGNTYTFTYNYQEGRKYFSGNSDSAHQEVECSGRGLCDRATGRCGCFDGFNGEACQRTTCPNDCSGHGVCQDERRFYNDATNGVYGAYDARKQMGCVCDEGFRGPDCGQIECPSGDDVMGGNGGSQGADCSGRGLCDYSAGLCQCFKGYYGERCEYQTNFV
jgi:hypothetical protein